MHRKAHKFVTITATNRLLPLALLISAALLAGCDKPVKQHDYSIFAFGTLIDISFYDVDKERAEAAFEQLQKNFDQYHQDWSPWSNGDLAKLNAQLNKNTAISVPEHLMPLIKTSMVLSQQSDNYYNPGIGQLINLWQFHKFKDKNIRPPDQDLIQGLVKKNPKMSDLTFNNNNQLINKNPALSFNFGAFAKGYAIALEIEYLKKLGINNAVINAGGDLSVIGQHGDRAWNIGIRHPRNDSILASIEVKDNESVFTSGDYERFYFHQGKRFHHILNPKTGYPAGGAQSVTVLHQDAGLADASATAIFVAGSKNWLQVAKKMKIHHVMLVDENGDIQITPALKKRIKFLNISPASHIIVSEEL